MGALPLRIPRPSPYRAKSSLKAGRRLLRERLRAAAIAHAAIFNPRAL